MYISKKVIFIHNPKVAGLSIRSVLYTHFGGAQTGRSRKIKNDHVHKVSAHSFASRVQNHPKVKRYWQNTYKFGVVRNPYDRAVSLWLYANKFVTPDGRLLLSVGLPENKNQLTTEIRERGFEFWLTEICPTYNWSPWPYLGHDGEAGFFDCPQIEWFVDEDNNLLVDDVFVLERLSDAEKKLSKKLGINFRISHLNKTEIEDIHTPETIKFITKQFAKDFDFFGYKTKL